MCTQPLKILNPSKRLAPDRGQQLWLYVPCGHCAECRQRLQNEWRVRSYYEVVNTIENLNGYALFDTLTYDDYHLPRVSDFEEVPSALDFSCFRSSDIQLFLKRLRINLERLGYDIKGKLRYFIASEYGTHNTLRPHYHPFFFVLDNVVPNLVLSREIARAWQNGRTDGLPYRTASYVNFHNTFRSVDQSQKRCIMYVAKYVAKDFLYSKMIVSRLYKLMCHKFPGFDWQLSGEQRNYYKWITRFVAPFHRQSLNFGDSYIDYQGGRASIIENGFLKFNFDGMPLTFSLFPSLKRKLFYNRNRVNGDVSWFLNNEGIIYRSKNINKQIASLKNEIDNYNLNNLDPVTFDPAKFILYHYRLQSPEMATVHNFTKTLVLSSSCTEFNSLRNYCSIDRSFIHKSVLTKSDYGSKKHGFSTLHKLRQVHTVADLDEESFISLEDFQRNYMCYDPSIEAQYSKLLQWKKIEGQKKLEVVKHNDRLKKLYKQLNLIL